MKNILLIILVLIPFLGMSQLPTTGGKKNLLIDSAITAESNDYRIDLDSTAMRNVYSKINPATDNLKSTWNWYYSIAGLINTASDSKKQIDQSIKGWEYQFNLNDIWSYDSIALDTAIDTVMHKYVGNRLLKDHGELDVEYDLFGFLILDTISFDNRMMDSLYVVVKFIEFENNDHMRAVFKWYYSKDAYLAGAKPIDSYNWFRNYTLPEFKPSINDWTFEYRKIWKNTEGFPTTNAGYTMFSL